MAEKANQTASAENTPTPLPPRQDAPVPASSHTVHTLRREIDHLFDEFARGFPRFDWARDLFELGPHHRTEVRPARITSNFAAAAPRANVSESEKEFVITVDLPGMGEDDVEVTIDSDVLTINGERSEETEEKDNDFRVVERHFGSFRRSFQLPDIVDQEKISAKFAKGVLTLKLAKSKEAVRQKRTIPIKAT